MIRPLLVLQIGFPLTAGAGCPGGEMADHIELPASWHNDVMTLVTYAKWNPVRLYIIWLMERAAYLGENTFIK